MTINKERLTLGLEALESDRFLRGVGKLKYKTGGQFFHCCLGVLCEVAKANGCEVIEIFEERQDRLIPCSTFDGNESNLPLSVQEWYGFEDPDPRISNSDDLYTCIDANDVRDWSYRDIAAALREIYIDESTGEVLANGESASDPENPQVTPADLSAAG